MLPHMGQRLIFCVHPLTSTSLDTSRGRTCVSQELSEHRGTGLGLEQSLWWKVWKTPNKSIDLQSLSKCYVFLAWHSLLFAARWTIRLRERLSLCFQTALSTTSPFSHGISTLATWWRFYKFLSQQQRIVTIWCVLVILWCYFIMCVYWIKLLHLHAFTWLCSVLRYELCHCIISITFNYSTLFTINIIGYWIILLYNACVIVMIAISRLHF